MYFDSYEHEGKMTAVPLHEEIREVSVNCQTLTHYN